MGVSKRQNKDRRFRGAGPRADLNKSKREEALVRQEAYDKLSVEEKLAHLDFKLGKGLGAKKEREKLLASEEKTENAKT